MELNRGTEWQDDTADLISAILWLYANYLPTRAATGVKFAIVKGTSVGKDVIMVHLDLGMGEEGYPIIPDRLMTKMELAMAMLCHDFRGLSPGGDAHRLSLTGGVLFVSWGRINLSDNTGLCFPVTSRLLREMYRARGSGISPYHHCVW